MFFIVNANTTETDFSDLEMPKLSQEEKLIFIDGQSLEQFVDDSFLVCLKINADLYQLPPMLLYDQIAQKKETPITRGIASFIEQMFKFGKDVYDVDVSKMYEIMGERFADYKSAIKLNFFGTSYSDYIRNNK